MNNVINKYKLTEVEIKRSSYNWAAEAANKQQKYQENIRSGKYVASEEQLSTNEIVTA